MKYVNVNITRAELFELVLIVSSIKECPTCTRDEYNTMSSFENLLTCFAERETRDSPMCVVTERNM